MLRQIIEAIDGFAPDAVIFGLDDRTASRAGGHLSRLQGRAGREGPGARRAARPRRRTARRPRPGHPHSPGPRGRRRQRLRGDVGAAQRLELHHHHLRPRRVRPHQRPHPGAPADQRRHQRLATAQLRARCTRCTASPPSTTSSTPRCAATPATTCPASRASARRPPRSCSSRSGPMPGDLGRHRPQRRGRRRRGLDSWAAETGARRLGSHRRTPPQRTWRARALRLQRADHVGSRRSRPRAHPRRPGQPGLLPLDVARVSHVVGYLNVEATTALAIRVLSGGR